MKNFNKKIQEVFAQMQATGKLFRVRLSGQEVWDAYLMAFPEGQDPSFRDPNSTSHNCNHCKNFIRRYGNIVAVDENNQLMSMFNVVTDEKYQASADFMNKLITSSVIENVFFETFDSLNDLPYESCKKTNNVFRLGINKNTKVYSVAEAQAFGYDAKTGTYSIVKPNEVREFNHFHLDLSKEFVKMGSESIESIMAKFRSDFDVFYRGMKEISLDTLKLVRDLINQDSILDARSHLPKIESMIKFKTEFNKLAEKDQKVWCWLKSYNLPIAKFRNELIGTLCQDLTTGKDLNESCKLWNIRVDPVNYMRAVAPITESQKKAAQKFAEENGYMDSFVRRFATSDDIDINEILHINTSNEVVKTASMFDSVKPAVQSQHKRAEFDKIQKVGIKAFMRDILPECTAIHAFLEPKHEANLMTMTTSVTPGSKGIFKWNNDKSITFNGNLSGTSQIKEAVKSYGGQTTGVLRFSISWAENMRDNSDLDAHCMEPRGNHIHFRNLVNFKTGGNLDIDITDPNRQRKPGHKSVVENITFPDLSKMDDGVYKLWVNQWSNRGSAGFKAEIEFDGNIYYYEYNKAVQGDVQVAEVTLRNGVFSIKHILPESDSVISQKEMYGLQSGQFHKVNLVCASPGHWGENNVGNKYHLFFLEGCKAPGAIRTFHNENLNSELAEHRKVLDVLGATNLVESTEKKQLSGIGFNETVRDELILKLEGTHKRTIKVEF